MKVHVAIAEVQLNEGKEYKEMLVIFNENGTLLVDEGLYSISCPGAIPSDINVNFIKTLKV